MLSSSKKSVSSHALARALGVTQKTAWFMLHRIRLLMKQGGFEPLSGEVEVDETFVGGKAKFQHQNKRAHRGTGGVGTIGSISAVARQHKAPSQTQPQDSAPHTTQAPDTDADSRCRLACHTGSSEKNCPP